MRRDNLEAVDFIKSEIASLHCTARETLQASSKLRLILSLLDAAQTVEGMRLPALKLHRLKGARSDIWAVTVQATSLKEKYLSQPQRTRLRLTRLNFCDVVR